MVSAQLIWSDGVHVPEPTIGLLSLLVGALDKRKNKTPAKLLRTQTVGRGSPLTWIIPWARLGSGPLHPGGLYLGWGQGSTPSTAFDDKMGSKKKTKSTRFAGSPKNSPLLPDTYTSLSTLISYRVGMMISIVQSHCLSLTRAFN
ncbi:hypothetical protein YC2023_061782 [Brassica napus]